MAGTIWLHILYSLIEEDSLMPDFFLDEFLEAQGGAEMAEEIVAKAEKPAIHR